VFGVQSRASRTVAGSGAADGEPGATVGDGAADEPDGGGVVATDGPQPASASAVARAMVDTRAMRRVGMCTGSDLP